jgi:hypothetical protein
MSALRGMPRNMTTYAATKAAVASLAEGIRADVRSAPITVSTIYPGYIRSEMNEGATNVPFMLDTETGCRHLARAIEREPAKAYVPRWPWAPLSVALRTLPLSVVAKLS